MDNPFIRPAGLYPANELSDKQLKAECELFQNIVPSLPLLSNRPITPIEKDMIHRQIELVEETIRREKK